MSLYVHNPFRSEYMSKTAFECQQTEDEMKQANRLLCIILLLNIHCVLKFRSGTTEIVKQVSTARIIHFSAFCSDTNLKSSKGTK